MKYIMFEIIGEPMKRFVPIIFPNLLVHKLVEQDIIRTLKRHNWNATVRSAGQIDLDSGKCFGESETLKVKFHKDDSKIINTTHMA
jgi:hypothetical protein